MPDPAQNTGLGRFRGGLNVRLAETPDPGVRTRSGRIRAERDVGLAADLHDYVVRELFGVGIGLQGVLELLPDAKLQTRLLGYVDSLDAVIDRIRTTIVELRSESRTQAHPDALRDLPRRVLDLLEEESRAVGGHASIVFSAPLTDGLPERLVDDLVAVIREAVSNVARHADASAIRVAISMADGVLVLDVIDDGRGIGSSSPNGGMTDMRLRAQSHDGSVTFTKPTGGGTHLQWTAHVG